MGSYSEAQVARARDLGLADTVQNALRRGVMTLSGSDITYHLHHQRRYRITDPEERVRALTIAHLVIAKGYDPHRIETEVIGRHNDYADVVLYRDARCTVPWLVVEDKRADASPSDRSEAETQAFANAVALGAAYAMVDLGASSVLWQVGGGVR